MTLLLSWRFGLLFLALNCLLTLIVFPVQAQMRAGTEIPEFSETLGVDLQMKRPPVNVQYTGSTAPANVLWPGEQAQFNFQVTNNTAEAIVQKANVELVPYGTKGRPGDIWVPQMFKMPGNLFVPIDINLGPNGYQNLTVSPKVPDLNGAYALVLDLGPLGRRFITSFVRTFKADPKPVQFPQLCLDNRDVDLLTRLGVAPNRMGISYKPTTDPDFDKWYKQQGEALMAYKKAGLAITVEFGGGAFYHQNQPLGRPRPWLDGKDVMLDTKFDLAWLPSWDPDFKKLVKMIVADYGWPKGPINGVKLWNEPWNGISISGWGADDLRYREIFTAMAEGVEDARKEAGVQVLLGGCDSSSNTFDKFFSDGSDTFLKWLDFCSVHYQGMGAPTTVKTWMNRKSPNGRVKIWDTESWVANTDDRVAAVVATNLSTGHDRAVGIYHGNVASEGQRGRIIGADGKPAQILYITTWSVAAAVGAATHFIGERRFNELLFKNGLPWVMVLHGNVNDKGVEDVEDGTIVVVGDIGEEFGANNVLFRTARGVAEIKHKQELRAQLAALPADAPVDERTKLEKAIATPEALTGATMTITDPKKQFQLFDFYGNPVLAKAGKIVVPLDMRGFFLRGNGKPGSFAALQQAIRTSRVDGIEPLAKECLDLNARIENKPNLTLRLTNVLNRPVTGTLTVTLGQLTLATPSQKIAFAANEMKVIAIPVTGGKSVENNTYPLQLVFNAGKDGSSEHSEDLHVDIVAHRTITVDGKLDDWANIPVQTIVDTGNAAPTLEESAWLPFMKFSPALGKGYANGWLAYDDNYLYFAAKVADSTPEDGMIRFADRNEDQYFYPEVSYWVNTQDSLQKQAVTWDNAKVEPFALQLPDDKAGKRSKTAWNNTVKSFAIDLTLPRNRLTQVALYFLDWDERERCAANVEIFDRDTNKRLKQQRMAEFGQGSYCVTVLTGNIRFKFTEIGGNIGIRMAGIFFDPGVVKAEPRKDKQSGEYLTFADLLPNDETTRGNWQGVYGKDGYYVFGADPKYPAYARVDVPDTRIEDKLVWPDGVRHFSYRKGPDLPAGNSPNHDNVQIAFNVVPDADKPWAMNPPGTMPKYTAYWDTDYEYALNPVAPQYGGGTEIWPLRRPDLPNKHFYPRDPKSPNEGPVKDGKLIVTRDGNTRISECAIPWQEIPDVKKALDAGRNIKFSFRVNDNAGTGCMELSRDRSVAKRNGQAFKVDWREHWANELEFAFEK